MDPPAAQITVQSVTPDGVASAATVRIGLPVPQPTGEYGCEVTLPDTPDPITVYGEDALQVLALAVRYVGGHILALETRGWRFFYEGTDEPIPFGYYFLPPPWHGAEAGIRERLPVWTALSEFFLDTELLEDDYVRISAVLAASPYAARELEAILRHEVYPACRHNLGPVAGAWAGFGEGWIRENIAPYLGKRPALTWPKFRWWMVRPHWDRVRRLLAEARIRESGGSAGTRPSESR